MTRALWLALAAAAAACAQPKVICQANIAVAPIIRSEGFTEQIGDIVLNCSGGATIPAGQLIPQTNITVGLNVPVSNLPVNPSSVCTEAILLIDEPNPGGQRVAPPSPSCSHPSLVSDGTNNFQNGSQPNIFQGKVTALNRVVFEGIPIYAPNTSGAVRVYRITNVRANVSETPIASGNVLQSNSGSAIPLNATITGSNDPGQPPPPAINPSGGQVGTILNPFLFNVDSGSAPANQPLNSSLLGSNPVLPTQPSATLNFHILFPNVLRAPAGNSQDIPGEAYNTDLGFFSSGFPSVFTNHGTQVQAVFQGIPPSVNVFVGTSVTSAIGLLQLVTPEPVTSPAGVMQLPVTNGSATAIWETIRADSTQTGDFAVPVYFAFQPGVAAPSQIQVVLSLGSPTGGVQFAQSPQVLAPILFSINTGLTPPPALSGAFDSRSCILGPIFWSGNACTPQNGPFVNIFADNAPAILSSPTFTTSGGITATVVTNSITPARDQVFVKAGTANPGVYQQSVNITQAEGGNSLSLPFTVTVLPPNNPIIEVGGFTDAFSYQSGRIAPGQIYTLFGTNFGPSNLVLGTLSSSGFLSTRVADTQVLFDGVASPLLYVTFGQLSGVAPFELAGRSSTNVQVISNGLTSPTVSVPVQASGISIASADGSGGNGGVILNQNGTLNTITNPASAGETVVMYASYAGPFANGVTGTDGRTTTAQPYPEPAGPVSVTFGGVPAAKIAYFGNAPTLLESVMQINAVIPAGAPTGLHVPVVISAGGATSVPWATIALH